MGVEKVGLNNDGNQTFDRPYRPSWIDYLAAWVERQRYPYWLFYLGLGLFCFLLLCAVSWVEGANLAESVGIAQTYLAAAMVFMLTLINYLDKQAGASLEAMRSSLTCDEETTQGLHYQLTMLPALPTVFASLAALGFVFVTEALSEPYQLYELTIYPVSANLLRVLYMICWMVFGVFLYHTFHQLRAINRVYTKYVKINLYRARPLYAFSNLAALTAGALAVLSYGWLLANPWIPKTDPLIFLPMIVLLLFSLVVFVLPQIGIHRLQRLEKERLMDEASQRFETATSVLHRRIDSGDLEDLASINTAMVSLETEMNVIKRTPTWPWEPETVRLLVTALALPLGLWLIQLILQRILGP